MDREKLLDQFAADPAQRLALAKVLDRRRRAEERGTAAWTAFLSPGEQAGAKGLLAALGQRGPRSFFFGGYAGAERAVCVFLPDWQEEGDFLERKPLPLAAVCFDPPADARLTHRDLLGAALGLGLSRERIGDILIGEQACQVLVLRESLPVFLTQWERVGRHRVQPRELDLAALVFPEAAVKTVRATVMQPRLDAVVSAGFSLGRGKAAELISAGRVKLNDSACEKPDRLVCQGDMISCRGLGRFQVKELGGRTKKGRTALSLARYQ